MSDPWATPAPALRAPTATIALAGTFTSWADKLRRVAAPVVDSDDGDAPVIDTSGIALDAFARGFEEGRRVQEVEFAADRAAFRRLAAALETLRPEPPAALAALIAETVGRLVRQVVGDAAVDGTLLLARAQAVAALVVDEARPARMRLSEADAPLLADAGLGVEIVADATLAPGAIILESRDGWVEDGVATALDRLRIQLDAMGVPR